MCSYKGPFINYVAREGEEGGLKNLEKNGYGWLRWRVGGVTGRSEKFGENGYCWLRCVWGGGGDRIKYMNSIFDSD